jgi:type II secretory pathway pseudopilin PulG
MRTGGSLVEVVVALVLLSVSGLAAVGLLHEAARTVRDAQDRERLLWAVGEIADSLTAAQGSGAGERPLAGGARVRWSVVERRGRVEGTLAGGAAPWVTLPVVHPPSGEERQ